MGQSTGCKRPSYKLAAAGCFRPQATARHVVVPESAARTPHAGLVVELVRRAFNVDGRPEPKCMSPKTDFARSQKTHASCSLVAEQRPEPSPSATRPAASAARTWQELLHTQSRPDGAHATDRLAGTAAATRLLVREAAFARDTPAVGKPRERGRHCAARRGASDPGGVEAGGHEWKSRWQSGRNPWMEAHSPPISRPRMGAEDDGPEKRTRLPDRLDPGGPGVPGSNKHCPTRGRRLVIGRSRASGSSAPAGAGGFLGGSAIHGLRCASPAATIRRPRLGAEWHSGPSPITSASAKFLALAFWGLGRSGDGSRGRLQPARQCPRLRPREGRPLVFLLSRSRLQPAFSCERDSQETSEKPAGSRLAQKRKKNGSVEGSATPT
jgi:hypothetical protein